MHLLYWGETEKRLISLSGMLENSSPVHFSVRPLTKDHCVLSLHRWIPTLKPGQKVPQPKPLLIFFFFLVLSRRARSQAGLDGSYLGPRGAGRVQTRASIIVVQKKEKKKRGAETPSNATALSLWNDNGHVEHIRISKCR